jgi:hypothetical protein
MKRSGLGFVGVGLAALLALAIVHASAAEDRSMEKQIAAAKTAADHEVIAALYDKEAKEAQAKADDHDKMSAAYKKVGGAVIEKLQLDQHCDKLAKNFRKAAKEAKALAEAHRQMAKETK